ncbi:PAS domain S-box protein [candidate division TA06 bacterium]|nr:PAS domain S-box protein [candidate division TA06 bacterium]
MKLSLKIGLITAAVAGSIAVSISLNHTFWEGQAWRTELRSHAATVADMLAVTVQESVLKNDFLALEQNVIRFSQRPEIAYAVVYDNAATPLAATGSQAGRQAIELYQENPKKHQKDIHKHVIEGQDIYELLIPVSIDGRDWGMLQVGFFENKILAIYHRTNVFNYLILLLGLGVSLTAGWLVARYLGKPIEALIEGTDQLVKNNYDHRINITRKDELGRLVSAFNTMAGTIRQDMVELGSKNRQLLKAQERQVWLARIAEQVGEGVAVCDLEGILTFVNHSWAAMHGYTPEQLVGKHISIFHSHSQLERELLPFNQKVIAQGLNAGVVGHIKKDRTVFYAETTTTILKNADGEAVGFIGVARDITGQKKAQEDLKKERDVIKSIFAATPDAVIITDLSGKFTEANDKAIELLELDSRDELMGKNFSLFIAPDDRGLALHNFQKTLDYGGVNNVQVNVMTARNGQFPLEYSTSLLHSIEGRPTHIVSVGRNIILRKRSELALAESEQRYRALAESSPDIIFVVNREGTIKYANSKAASIAGLAEGQANGRNITEFFDQCINEKQKEQLLSVFQTGRTAHYELPTPIRGRELWLETWLVPLTGQDGTVAEVMGLCRDLTERRQAELAVRDVNQRFEYALGATKTGYDIIDTEYNIQYIDPEWKKSYGEPAGRKCYEYFMDRKEICPACGITKALRDKQSVVTEEYLVKEKRWVEVHTIPYQNSSGQWLVAEFNIDINERKLNEQKLKISEQKYRELADTLPQTVFEMDDQGILVYVNNTGLSQFGYTQEESRSGLKVLSMLAPQDRERAGQNIVRRLKGNPAENQEYLALRKDGSTFPISIYASPVLEEGQISGLRGVIVDISERKKGEQTLKESETRFRALAEASPAGIFAYLEKFIYANPACQVLTGYSPEELLKMNFWELVHPEHREMVKKRGLARQKGVNVPANYEFKIIRKDGQLRWVDFAGTLTQFDGRQSGLGMILDITERKSMEEILQASEAQYRTTIDSIGDAIHVVDSGLNILLANAVFKAWCRRLDLAEDPAGRNVFEVCPFLSPQVRQEYQQVFETGQPVTTQDENTVSGKVLITETRKIPIFEGTKVSRVITVIRDITEEKESERKLAESERKYSQIFEDIVEGIYRTTPSGQVLLANPALVRMLGFENLEQLISLDLNKSGYMDISSRNRFKELMERDGQVLGFEARWRRPDGKILMISENARAVRDQQGKVQYYEGTIEDITERQKAEEDLLNEKNKLSDLFRVSLQVARAGDIQKKLDLTMEGIAGTGLFSRAVLVLKNEEGRNSHIAHFGMTSKEIAAILKAGPAQAEKLEKIFNKKYRYSSSYFIPHDAPGVDFSIKLINKQYQPTGDWHSDDVLLVPLMVKDKHIGYLTVDEPVDGRIPSLETVRLLELFCYQVAVAIDNLRLYNDLEQSYYGTLKAFVAAMDAKDPYTKGHSENVRFHALNIARQLKLPEEQVKLIDFSSLLHDIGKLAIRDEILTKPSLLSDHEYQEVKLHPVIGSHLVSEVESLLKVAPIIHSHHEHFDGSGYPQGIKGDEIPLEARIIAVADAFEAMTSDRPYRKAFDLKVAVNRLQEAAGTQFDKEIVRVFIKLHQETHG